MRVLGSGLGSPLEELRLIEELRPPANALVARPERYVYLKRRFEDAGRLQERIAALEGVCRELDRLARMRRARCCLVVPALEPRFARAYFLAGGRIAAVRTLPPGDGAHLEIEAGPHPADGRRRAPPNKQFFETAHLAGAF